MRRVVGHFNEHAIAVEAAAECYGAAVEARFKTVLDAVFNQRL